MRSRVSWITYLLGAAAIAEIAVVTLLGNLGGRALAGLVGAFAGLDPDVLNESYSGAAALTAVSLAARFGCLLLLAFAVLWFGRRRSPRDAGVSTGSRPLGRLIGIGILLFAVSSLPQKLLFLIHTAVPIGEGLAAWRAYATTPWTGAYLGFVLVAQVVLPPLLEEPLARGYFRDRLHLVFGPVGSCWISAALFMLGHGHFYVADPLVLGALLTALFAAACWAWVTWRTGSIVPAVVAHALGNIPLPYTRAWLVPVVVLMIALAVWKWRSVGLELTKAADSWSRAPKLLVTWGLVLGSAIWPVTVLARLDFLYLAAGLLPLAAVAWLPSLRRREESSGRGTAVPPRAAQKLSSEIDLPSPPRRRGASRG